MDHELNKWAKSERRWALAGIARLPGAAAQRRPAAAAAVLLLLALLANRRSLYRTGQDAFASIYYGLDPAFLGRSEALYPAPRCCHDEGCVAPRTPPRAAVVTYLRGADYLPLLQQLECTLARSNPGGLELAAMVVEGELDEALLARVRELGITLLPVAALEYPNSYERRYSRNWVKIRAFGLTQYDALLLVDADEAVVGDLSPLFALPAEFAAVWDQSRWLGRWKTAVRAGRRTALALYACCCLSGRAAPGAGWWQVWPLGDCSEGGRGWPWLVGACCWDGWAALGTGRPAMLWVLPLRLLLLLLLGGERCSSTSAQAPHTQSIPLSLSPAGRPPRCG